MKIPRALIDIYCVVYDIPSGNAKAKIMQLIDYMQKDLYKKGIHKTHNELIILFCEQITNKYKEEKEKEKIKIDIKDVSYEGI